MKKIFSLLLCITALTFALSHAQTSPIINNRSGSSSQQSDDYLIGLKRLGIPTSTTDNLDADFAAENTRKLLFNTTLNKLRVYSPATNIWSDAAATDIASVAGLQAALDGKANDDAVLKLAGGYQTITAPKSFAGGVNFDSYSYFFHPLTSYSTGRFTGLTVGDNDLVGSTGYIDFVEDGNFNTVRLEPTQGTDYGVKFKLPLKPTGDYNLATTTDLDSKANLTGDNNFTGSQRISGNLSIDGAASSHRELMFKTNNVLRWDLYAIGEETGSNSGSNLYLASYNDVGEYQGNVFSINRASNVLNFMTRPQIGGNNIISSDGGNYSLNIDGYSNSVTNNEISGQNIANSHAVQAGRFRAMNGHNIIGAPSNSYWNILSLRHSNSANDYRMEIAGDFYANDIKFRNTNNNPSQGWNTFFHSGNTDYTRTVLGLPANPLRSHRAVEWISYPGADANTIEENTSSFTYNYHAPAVGPLAHFGNSGYGLQLNASYSGAGALHFRTRNGDISSWNEWKPLVFEGFGYTWGININGSSNKWNDNTFNLGEVAAPTYFVTGVGNSAWGYSSASQLKASLGLPSMGGYALDDVASRGNSLTRDIAFSAHNNIGLKWAYSGDLSALYYNNGANGNGKVVLDIGDDNMLSQGFQIRGVRYDNVINEVAYFSANGSVGIGTTTPSEKLAVNGKIRAREVKVEPVNGWPDYVFKEGYRPLSLAELSEFIREKKHLPEVPSAKDVETNGLELGEMNKILLKKIEELTLHLIEKEEQINAEKTVNKIQSQQILALEQQFLVLKNLVEKMQKK